MAVRLMPSAATRRKLPDLIKQWWRHEMNIQQGQVRLLFEKQQLLTGERTAHGSGTLFQCLHIFTICHPVNKTPLKHNISNLQTFLWKGYNLLYIYACHKAHNASCIRPFIFISQGHNKYTLLFLQEACGMLSQASVIIRRKKTNLFH